MIRTQSDRINTADGFQNHDRSFFTQTHYTLIKYSEANLTFGGPAGILPLYSLINGGLSEEGGE